MKTLIIIVCALIALYCGALTGFSSIIIWALIGGAIGIVYTIITAKKNPDTKESQQTEILKQKIDSTESQIEQIEKYKQLKDKGLITQEEFDEKKKQILGL